MMNYVNSTVTTSETIFPSTWIANTVWGETTLSLSVCLHSVLNLRVVTERMMWRTKGEEPSDAGWPPCRATSPSIWQVQPEVAQLGKGSLYLPPSGVVSSGLQNHSWNAISQQVHPGPCCSGTATEEDIFVHYCTHWGFLNSHHIIYINNAAVSLLNHSLTAIIRHCKSFLDM